MNNNSNQPTEFDAVLGGKAQPPVNGVVLGGIHKNKSSLKSSILTESLDRILKALEEKDPEIASRLQPGLTRKEIDEITKDLPFNLPEELYELYQWRNGLSNYIVFGCGKWNGIQLIFSSLVEAVNDFHNLKKRGSPSNLFRVFLLIHQLGGDYFAVLLGDETTPIIHFDDNREIFIDKINYFKKSAFFSNLTTFMYAIAECFKDAIYTETDSNGYISWEFDEDKVKAIIHKYNSGNFKIYRA